MTVKYYSGDIFHNLSQFDAIGHGCNCQGSMGKGIAVEFKRRWPFMYRDYRNLCQSKKLHPGDIFPYTTKDDLVVLNLMTQRNYWGKDKAKLKHVRNCMKALKDLCENHKLLNTGKKTIAIPRVAAGIGGLKHKWPEIKSIFEEFFGDSDRVTLCVVEDYVAKCSLKEKAK